MILAVFKEELPHFSEFEIDECWILWHLTLNISNLSVLFVVSCDWTCMFLARDVSFNGLVSLWVSVDITKL